MQSDSSFVVTSGFYVIQIVTFPFQNYNIFKILRTSFSILQFHLFYFLIKVQMIYSVPISAVQQSDPVIHIYNRYIDTQMDRQTDRQTDRQIDRYLLFLILSSIMFYPKRLDIVSCAIQEDLVAYPFYVIVCTYQPQTPSPSPSLSPPLWQHVGLDISLFIPPSCTVGLLQSAYWVPPPNLYVEIISQQNGFRRWSLWEVIRFR